MRGHSVAWSVALSALLGAFGYFASARFELFEWLFQTTRRYESLELDEILTVLFFVSVGLAFFYWRSLKRSEEKLRRREGRFRDIVDKAADAIVIHDLSGKILDANRSARESLGYSREELVGMNVSDIEEDFDSEVFGRRRKLLPAGEQLTVDGIHKRKDGSSFPVEARLSVLETNGERMILSLARDVSQSRKAMEELRASEARNRAVLEAIPDAVFRFGRGGEYLDVHLNESFRPFTDREPVLGKTVEDVLPPEVAKEFMRAIPEVLDTGERREFEYEIAVGEEGLHREARLVKSDVGEVTCFVRDIGERREFESKIKRLAYHDELTDLPNRAAFMESLAAGGPGKAAVAVLSLRGFDKVNDSLGREAGDRLLSMVARHMRDFFGAMGEVTRFGGDEFAALLRGFESFDEVLELIERGQQIYPRMPFLLDEMEVFLRADVGVAEVEDGDTPDEAVRKASIALLEAKKDPEADYKVYDRSMGEEAVERLRLERDLRLALEYGQLEVHYQPEVFLSSGRIYSLEALARWNHPEHGPIGPSVFIPLAEESGLIIRLGEYVLEEACRRMRMWRETLSEGAPCSVSVNISALQLRQRDLVSRISRILDENGLEPECLRIEITESAAVEDLDSCRRVFEELKKLGIRIALDDFGTGYSSLSYLRQFPLDSLKVDRSFVSTLEDDPQMANVVGSIIELAHALELEVVSEGIETFEGLWGFGVHVAARTRSSLRRHRNPRTTLHPAPPRLRHRTRLPLLAPRPARGGARPPRVVADARLAPRDGVRSLRLRLRSGE